MDAALSCSRPQAAPKLLPVDAFRRSMPRKRSKGEGAVPPLGVCHSALVPSFIGQKIDRWSPSLVEVFTGNRVAPRSPKAGLQASPKWSRRNRNVIPRTLPKRSHAQ